MAHNLKDMTARSYHPNPSVARGKMAALKDLMGPEDKEGEGHPHEADVAEHGPIHKSMVESEGGKHTVVAHHEDGHIGRHEHPDIESAHAHHAAIMGGAGGESNRHEAGESPEFEAGEREGAQEESCPSCGGEMENGKCKTCGYEEDAGEGPGAEQAER
jgi:hypothetical protein